MGTALKKPRPYRLLLVTFDLSDTQPGDRRYRDADRSDNECHLTPLLIDPPEGQDGNYRSRAACKHEAECVRSASVCFSFVDFE